MDCLNQIYTIAHVAEWQSGHAADCNRLRRFDSTSSNAYLYLSIHNPKEFMKKVVVSGGFDPVLIGHLEMLQKAKEIGSHLTVILNSDKFLLDKKGFVFMNFKERKKILLGFDCVDKVIKCVDKDNTVCQTISKLKEKNEIDIFANGGDRKNEKDIPEFEVCKKLGVKMIFDVGGNKIQ